MFGFLNTSILFAAAAALIPLIIHLFSRRRVKVVEFSSVRHLKQMQRRQLRRLKIRQWLLLALRMLIILVIVLAFARPTLRRGAVGSHAAVSAVIMMDNSASMNRSVADGNLFELARRRTGQLLSTFKQSDAVCLMPLDRSASEGPLRLVSAAAAEEQLEALQCGGGQADFRTGLQQALELLGNAPSLNRELYIVSDRQRTSLPDESTFDVEGVKLFVVDLPLEDNENVGVVSVDLGGQLIQPGHDFDIVATIANRGGHDSGERIASLFLDGNRVAQTDFEVSGGDETTVRFTRAVSSTGFHSGHVELSDDKFAGDNSYYFSFRLPDQFNLLVIDGDPSARFIALALNPPTSGGQYWSVKTASPDDLAGVNFNEYDVVVLAGAPDIGTPYNSRLNSAIVRGRSLFVTYGPNMDINNFNRYWGEATGVRYLEPVKRDFTRAGFYSFQALDPDHPVFSVFNFKDNKPPEVKFYTLPKLETDPEVRTLLQFTGGRPALVESKLGRGKVLTFTGPMSPEYSDLVSHGFFVPMISRIAEYLASDLTSLDVDLRTGQSISRGITVTGAPVYAVDLIGPDSSVVALAPEDQGGALVVRTEPLDRTGIYHVDSRGREVDRFAVNLNPAEGNLTAADPEQFAMSLGTSDFNEVAYKANMAETIAGFRVGRELWQLFLWIAVVLMALEMLLGRRLPSEE